MSATLLIGVDYSTQADKVGLACGRLKGEALEIEFAKCPGTHAAVKEQIIAWIEKEKKKKNGAILLAIDAPLGWPKPLSESLCSHKAGDALSEPTTDRMFMRKTDWWVREVIGKTPLKVGADKIALQAHHALSFLDKLRSEHGPIPLAWNPENVQGVSVIEVYPGATLKAFGFPYKGYKDEKKEAHVEARACIIRRLDNKMELCENVKNKMQENSDILDAVVCVRAAADFVDENIPLISPEKSKDRELAEKEGWIWVRKP